MEGDLVAGAEKEIIARVRAGEAEAYAELMRAHMTIAHRTAVLLGAGADAEDVVQNSFVKAYLALGAFREGASFRPWLLRIVANETRNAVRSAQRLRTAVGREALLTGLGRKAEPPIPESADPAVAVVAGERRERLLAALDKLSEPHRRVVTCRYLLDLDESETAETLGWPRGTVKSRLNRALRRLEKLLGDGEPIGVGAEERYGERAGGKSMKAAGEAFGELGKASGEKAGEAFEGPGEASGKTAREASGEKAGKASGERAGKTFGEMAGAGEGGGSDGEE